MVDVEATRSLVLFGSDAGFEALRGMLHLLGALLAGMYGATRLKAIWVRLYGGARP